eukprot:Hpha_TRINITY_DN21022_c0_g1::TRINITY_DN21022_c0_g1_i1::g.103363::m.103363
MNHQFLPGASGSQLLPKLSEVLGSGAITGDEQLVQALWHRCRETAANQRAAVQIFVELLATLAPRAAPVATVPPEVDTALWQYECMRGYLADMARVVTSLGSVCTPETCPRMTATSEWLFLCACHKAPQECPAIDYALHTLDGAATVLNSSKYFTATKQPEKVPEALYGNMIRRLYRILAHAWHHHKEEFLVIEEATRTCDRFVRFALRFGYLDKKKHLLMPYPDV